VGIRNYLIEGVSGTGKTSVCDELTRRGFQAIHGDRELAYQGDPRTGEPITEGFGHDNHLWRIDRVKALVADRSEPVTFFCGGSRNFPAFIHLFDGVFVLDVDAGTLTERLSRRPDDEYGGRPEQRRHVLRLHETKEDIPSDGIVIDATAPLGTVVDEILRHAG
jgi:thymidylate kinase